MIRPLLRRVRPANPANAGIAITGVLALLLILRWLVTSPLTLSEAELEAFWTAPRDDAAKQYDEHRLSLLDAEGFQPHSVARSLRSPPWTAEGIPTLDAHTDKYAARLGGFVFKYLNQAPMRSRLDHAVARVLKQVPPTIATFPRKLYSADRLGEAGVPDMFRLWNALVPLPVGGDLENLLPQTDWAEPARRTKSWGGGVADPSDMETELSTWIGDSIAVGTSEWTKFWRDVGKESHRAQIFKYMAMLFEGGLFAATDTIPIAHPYLWGLGAKSILHPDLELMKRVLMKHAASSDSTHRRLWERGTPAEAEPQQETQTPVQTSWTPPENVWDDLDPVQADDVGSIPGSDPQSQQNSNSNNNNTNSYVPPYPSTHRHVRRRAHLRFRQPSQPDEATSILSPEINLVVGVAWDSSISKTPSQWYRWSITRLKRSLNLFGPGRSLQFSTSVILAKPYHPVFLDTIATIWHSFENDGPAKLDPIDLTGSGPFTDAVLRYLLVRYGVTPAKLRGLKGPVRVGDVLILQEESLYAPPAATTAMLEYVRKFFPMLPGSGVAHTIEGTTLWYWGAGWRNFWSSGRRVVSRNGPGADDMEDAPDFLDD